MTEIVRASLGLPTLRAGPQFQNSNAVWVIGFWNLFVIWCLGFGISHCEMFDDLNDFNGFNECNGF
jgi:hypothetical protein